MALDRALIANYRAAMARLAGLKGKPSVYDWAAELGHPLSKKGRPSAAAHHAALVAMLEDSDPTSIPSWVHAVACNTIHGTITLRTNKIT
jgi:hypothetical protein